MDCVVNVGCEIPPNSFLHQLSNFFEVTAWMKNAKWSWPTLWLWETDRFSDICLPILVLKTVIVSCKCLKQSYTWPFRISNLNTAKIKQSLGIASFWETFGSKPHLFPIVCLTGPKRRKSRVYFASRNLGSKLFGKLDTIIDVVAAVCFAV